MAGRPEGVAAREALAFLRCKTALRPVEPTLSVAFGDISPSRGEIIRATTKKPPGCPGGFR